MKQSNRNAPSSIPDATTGLTNLHPGEILARDFLIPLEISQYRLAKSIQVPPRRINEIIHGERAVTADTALRLALFFGNNARFWMDLQAEFDLRRTWRLHGKNLTREIIPVHQVS